MEFVKARSFRISGVKDRGTYNASICDTAEAARSQSWNLLQQNRTLPLAHKHVKSRTQMSKYYDLKNIFSATVQMKYKYTMNYCDFMLCRVSFLLSPVSLRRPLQDFLGREMTRHTWREALVVELSPRWRLTPCFHVLAIIKSLYFRLKEKTDFSTTHVICGNFIDFF